MPLRPFSSDLLVDHQDERISALERQLEEMRELFDGLQEMITTTEEGDLVIQGVSIRIEAENELELRAGNSCTITSMATTRIDATGNLEIQTGTMNVNASNLTNTAAIANYSGIVRCNTMQCDTVIAATYTPGAGNVW